MLNSEALTNATLAFNPKGDFGERQLHTLPYRMMPAYDAANGDHQQIAVLSEDIATLAHRHSTPCLYPPNPSTAMTARRRKLRTLRQASQQLARCPTLTPSRTRGAPTPPPHINAASTHPPI